MNHFDPFEPQDELAERLTRALETPPFVVPSAGFAARMAARAQKLPQPQATAQPPRTTFAAGLAFAALLLTMLTLAPRAASQGTFSLPAMVECLLAAQFVLLTVCFSLRPILERA